MNVGLIVSDLNDTERTKSCTERYQLLIGLLERILYLSFFANILGRTHAKS